MGRAGFWNKQRVSAARHYRNGVRAYCAKHGTTFESMRSYCAKHGLSYESIVLDKAGNNRWTFQLFQEALKSPSARQFCNTHNLSYMTFNNFKKYGFPGKEVKKKELLQCSVSSDSVTDGFTPEELTEEELNVFDFNDITLDDVPALEESTNTSDTKIEVLRYPNGDIKWDLDLINKIKSYPGGVRKCLEELGITYTAYRTACRRGSTKHKGHPSTTDWTDELVETVRNAPEGTISYCESHNLSYSSYVYACRKRGLSSASTVKSSSELAKENEAKRLNSDLFDTDSCGRVKWTEELIDIVRSAPEGIRSFLDKHGIGYSSFTSACERRHISTKSLANPDSDRLDESVARHGFWTKEKIEEVKAAAIESGYSIDEYCNMNGLNKNSYYHACKRNNINPRVKFKVWSKELVLQAQSYLTENPNGLEKFCEDNNLPPNSYNSACERFGITSAPTVEPKEIIPDIAEQSLVESPDETASYSNTEVPMKVKLEVKPELRKYKSSVTIKYKDGKTKVIERDEIFMFLCSNQTDIDEMVVKGDCTISFS